MVSLFAFNKIRHKIRLSPHSIKKELVYKYNTNENLSFKNWIIYTHSIQPDHRFNSSQIDWLNDKGGNILVDHIARFEKLEQEWKYICDQLDINANLVHLQKTDRTHYRDYYDDQSKEIVETMFAKDIEFFGYEF